MLKHEVFSGVGILIHPNHPVLMNRVFHGCGQTNQLLGVRGNELHPRHRKNGTSDNRTGDGMGVSRDAEGKGVPWWPNPF